MATRPLPYAALFSPLFLLLHAVRATSGDDPADVAQLAKCVSQLHPRVVPAEGSGARPERLKEMLREHVRQRRQALNRADGEAWRTLRTREEWERWKAPRIAALRRSLGQFPDPPKDLKVQATKVLEGEGFRVECLVFESRPGLLVTANLYRPAQRLPMMPGILICHSHHNPKVQGELQDMGMSWARQGCLVLIMDQLGHGERRQHPFRTAADDSHPFAVGRQDYYFRYNVGIQLHVIGDSLIGWMVWDLMRGVDLLLAQPGMDPQRIMLLGSVAGGGDPAAVAAAIDERIQVAVPFNFGGPQPETTYPLPADAEQSFDYIGGGSWESTRNLRLSARDGFLPWVIVGAIAPRRLVYAHEFSWDQQKDPVWRRLQAIYSWYAASENLASVHGWGRVTLPATQASHCNNIGLPHRQQMYPAFERWWGIRLDREYQNRWADARLLCLEGVAQAQSLKLTPVCRLADELAGERMLAFRNRLAGQSRQSQRAALRGKWSELLGDVEPGTFSASRLAPVTEGLVRVMRVVHETQRGILVPTMVLLPADSAIPRPCVVGVAQAGKEEFLQRRSVEIAQLLNRGLAVCLPDLRGTGETGFERDRGRRSESTAISSSELMLGNTLLGLRIKDLRSVIRWLRTLPEIDAGRIAVWGESWAGTNGPGRRVDVPQGIGDEPAVAEPLGPMAALLAALLDEEIVAMVARGGLVGYRSLLGSPFVHIPHDVVIPGALTAGDLADVAGALAPRAVLVQRCVDGANRPVPAEVVRAEWGPAVAAYRRAGEPGQLVIEDGDQPFAGWLARQLVAPR